jgi:ubiquitin-protein ligase
VCWQATQPFASSACTGSTGAQHEQDAAALCNCQKRGCLHVCRSVNLMKWTCLVPGKKGTDWEDGVYPITLQFTEDYPAKPPIVRHQQSCVHISSRPHGAWQHMSCAVTAAAASVG